MKGNSTDTSDSDLVMERMSQADEILTPLVQPDHKTARCEPMHLCRSDRPAINNSSPPRVIYSRSRRPVASQRVHCKHIGKPSGAQAPSSIS